MNKVQKGKTQLLVLVIICITIGLCLLIGGIVCTVKNISNMTQDNIASSIFLVILGIVLALCGITSIGFSTYWLFIALSLKATKGNIADKNEVANKTVNMEKCPNCGEEVNSTDLVCGKCGHLLSDTKVCPSCGATNNSDNKVCSACGKEF